MSQSMETSFSAYSTLPRAMLPVFFLLSVFAPCVLKDNSTKQVASPCINIQISLKPIFPYNFNSVWPCWWPVF